VAAEDRTAQPRPTAARLPELALHFTAILRGRDDGVGIPSAGRARSRPPPDPPVIRVPAERYGRVNLFVEVAAVYVRVVRFTDVSAERIEGLLASIEESEGPPPGVPTTGLKMLYDEAQGTAVVLQYFATAEDMDAGAQAFSAMDAAETPGTRASVDMCEIKLEVDVS